MARKKTKAGGDKDYLPSKRYDNLFLHRKNETWYFRKYSSEKGKEFKRSTKVKGKINEAKAYKEGKRLFDEWLGIEDYSGKESMFFRYHAEKYLKSQTKDLDARVISFGTWQKTTICTKKHLVPRFGRLKINQITEERWDDFWKESHTKIWKEYGHLVKTGEMITEEVEDKYFRFFNVRKTLMQILIRANKKGYIRVLPKFKNPDPPSRKHKYLTKPQIKKLIKNSPPKTTRLLALFVYQQGLRPGTALKLKWNQAHFFHEKEGKKKILKGRLEVLPSQAKTRRANKVPIPEPLLSILFERKKASKSPYIFPSYSDPNRHQTQYRDGWRAACERSNVTATIYDLRHTMLTDLADSGANVYHVANYTDTSVEMLTKVYYKNRFKTLEEIAHATPMGFISECWDQEYSQEGSSSDK